MSSTPGAGGGGGLHLVERVLARSPFQAVARLANGKRLCVLAYHGVSDAARFAEHLDWLVANTRPVGIDAVERHVLDGAVLPPHPVLVTFDDGCPSVLEVAAPLLRERLIPAVAYVVAGLIDTERPYWWTEVEELVTAGGDGPGSAHEVIRRLKLLPDTARRAEIDRLRGDGRRAVLGRQLTSDELRRLETQGVLIGSHSLTHPCLDMCDSEVVLREVQESHRLLTSILGHPPTSFAYPNGNHDARVRRAVMEAGYTLGFTFDHRLATRPIDPMAVSRIRIDSSASIERLSLLVSGLHSGLHRIRRRP